MVLGLLDSVKSILSSKYSIHLSNVPATGNCVVISESSVDYTNATLDLGSYDKTVNLSFYIRVQAFSGVYDDIKAELGSFYSTIESRWGLTIGNFSVLSVGLPSILPAGQDKDKNFIASMNFQLTYSEERV